MINTKQARKMSGFTNLKSRPHGTSHVSIFFQEAMFQSFHSNSSKMSKFIIFLHK